MNTQFPAYPGPIHPPPTTLGQNVQLTEQAVRQYEDKFEPQYDNLQNIPAELSSSRQNVRAYGALGDGTTDDRQAFVDAEVAGEQGFVPAGTYLINSNLTLSKAWVFSKGAKIKPASGVTVTLNGAFETGLYQIFDVSAGGIIAGDPAVPAARPEWWHDGGVDWSTALSKAVAFAQQSTTNKVKRVEIPALCEISSTVSFKDHTSSFVRFPITLAGRGASREGSASIIKATAAMVTMFDLPSSGGAGTNAYYNFEGICFNGNSLANHAIRGPRLGYAIFDRCTWLDTLVSAVEGDDAVETLTFIEPRFIGNADCLRLGAVGATMNDIRMFGGECSSNSGIAVNIAGGAALAIHGVTFQSCAKAAIYARRLLGLSLVGSRFEDNGLTGVEYTTPAYGVKKCDIHIHGEESAVGVMGSGEESANIDVQGCVFTNGGAIDAHFLVSNVRGLKIRNNRIQNHDKLILGMADENYGWQKYWEIDGNTEGTTELDTDLPTTVYASLDNDTPAYRHHRDLHTHKYSHIPVVNFFNRDATTWTIQEGTGGTADNAGTVYYLGKQASRVVSSGGATGALGGDIDPAVYTELRGRWIWFGGWVNTGGAADFDADLYLATAGGTTRGGYRHDPVSGTAQRPNAFIFMSMAVYVDPAATNISAGFAIKQVGATPPGAVVLHVVNPTLAIVGVPFSAV